MNRRLTAIIAAVTVAFGGGAAIVASSAAQHSGASTVTWYQCVNAKGAIESKNGGTHIPICAHPSDTILQWQVNVGTLPPTTTTPTTVAPTTAATVPPTTQPARTLPPPPSWWTPDNEHSLAWWDQQNGTVGVHAGINVYDTDWSVTTPTQVAAFHVSDAKAVCQVNAGAFEPGRPDANQFPASALGSPVFPAPPGLQWLDIRNATIRGIEVARIETCKQKGFDAVDFTDVDGYANPTGFPLTGIDQQIYNAFLADTAHANGLAAGLNEDRAQIGTLQPSFDFGVAEEAQFLGQAGDFASFTGADKPVFDVEFVGAPGVYCPQDAFDRIDGLHANVALSGVGYFNCPPW